MKIIPAILTVFLSTSGSFGRDVAIDQQPSLATTPATSLFNYLSGSSNITEIDNSDGYLVYRYDVYKTSYTNNSILVLIRHYLQFVPGYVASNYNSSYFNGSYTGKGYFSVVYSKYQTNSYAFGGDLTLKESWPRSSSVTATIGSTYGSTLSSSLENKIGISYGFGNGAEGSFSSASTTTVSYSWSESASNVVSNPILSAQSMPDEANGYYWIYEITALDNGGSANASQRLTYQLEAYSLLEIRKNAINVAESAFFMDLEFRMQNTYWHSGWFIHEWRYGTQFTQTGSVGFTQ